jgi:hypothetical protein
LRPRGRLALAALTAVALTAAGAAADRSEPRRSSALATRAPSSGAWLCPHGGGREWTTHLYVANPGSTASRIRVTTMGTGQEAEPSTATVPPGSEVRLDVPSDDAAAASYVEFFGAWVAAGWVTSAGDAASGVAAEPCAAEPGTRWFAADGSTEQGQDAHIVVMNPFDVDAVVDVTVFSRRAPIRQSSFTNVPVASHHSVLMRLNTVSADEPAAAAEVVAHAGRVAVASLGVSRDGGIRSALATTAPSTRVLLSGTRDVGQSTLAIMAPDPDEARFGATLLSEEEPEPAGGLTASAQSGQSARAYPLITQGPSVVEVRASSDSPPIVAVRRSEGENGDPGATGGTPTAAATWVVLPTVGGSPNAPGMVLGNPGSTPVEVALTLLGADGVVDDTSVSVPPTSAVGVPVGFIERDPFGAVVATSVDGAFVAAGASSSLGQEGVAAYAAGAGVPVPDWVHVRR